MIAVGPSGWLFSPTLEPGALGCLFPPPGTRSQEPADAHPRRAPRDLSEQFAALDTDIFGLSTQDPDYQLEAATRLHLRYALLSDAELRLTAALRLPTLSVDGMTLLRRLTLIIDDGRVEHVIYPVFPPDGAATDVLAVLLR